MKYLHQVLNVKRGTHLKVHFSQPTRVFLLSDHNYKKYKDCKTYNYWGGMKEKSPCEFIIPNDAIWHVIVEKGGYYNPINMAASVNILSAL